MVRSWRFSLIALVGLFSMPFLAEAMDCPEPMEPTVHSLQSCVQHATDMGAIDNAGIANSLLVKLRSAEMSLARDKQNAYWTTINILGAFIGEVEAQSGKHIDPEHARHMEMHAQMIIDALRASVSLPTSS